MGFTSRGAVRRVGRKLLVGSATGFRRRPVLKRSQAPAEGINRILAVAGTGHGASLAYLDSDGVVRASQLERWTGTKHMLLFSRDEDRALRNPQGAVDEAIHYVLTVGFGRFPDTAIFEDVIDPWFEWLVGDLGVTPADIDLVVSSDGHFATGWARLGPHLDRWFPNAKVSTEIEHHEIHQRQAFWQSGFEEAAVLTLDTCGDELDRLGGRKLAGTIATMNRNGECKIHREFFFPEMSSGVIYSATSLHLGFLQGEEGKTMGLAPFGRPEFLAVVEPHLELHPDGGFTFMGIEEYEAAMEEYAPAREKGGDLTARHENIAWAAQEIIDRIVVNAWRAALDLTGQRDLVYAGGVALNSVANEKANLAARPRRFYVSPCPGDPGHALGCALFGAYELAGWEHTGREVPEYLGPPASTVDMEAAVAASGHEVLRPDDLEATLAQIVANGHIVGRYDGGAEFGPRALGNRSIVCDPRRPGMKDYLNLRVKHREPFRPFAPSVLEEHAGEWFDLEGPSPYMLRVVDVLPDKIDVVPAITHVDGTARVQTVTAAQNPGYRRLIEAFHGITGVPMVLNTSFNLAGKPIVESPADAVECYLATEIDVLAVGPFVIAKRPLADYLTEDSGA